MTVSAEDPEQLFTAWMRDYRGILFKVARSFASDPVSQGELAQEMMVQLWRSLPRYRADASPSTWIYRVSLNTAITWRRGETRAQARSAPLADLTELVCPAPRPADAHENAEALAALYAAVRTLAPVERSLVLLLLDGLSYREIADISGLTENHVGVALTRARKKLAEAMKEVRREH